MSDDAYFTPALFGFLRDLAAHNDREWFKANQARYEADVREPLLAFIADFSPRLEQISEHYLADARKVGGSLFRIYRDTRFGKDKTPYKTNAGAHFRHLRGKDVHAPGFYLHLEPSEAFMASGIWHPDRDALGLIRDAIVADPKGWQAVQPGTGLPESFHLEGDALKRGPKGYDIDHPLIDDLKRKDFFVLTELGEADVVADDFMQRFADLCQAAAPFTAFLTHAVELDF